MTEEIKKNGICLDGGFSKIPHSMIKNIEYEKGLMAHCLIQYMTYNKSSAWIANSLFYKLGISKNMLKKVIPELSDNYGIEIESIGERTKKYSIDPSFFEDTKKKNHNIGEFWISAPHPFVISGEIPIEFKLLFLCLAMYTDEKENIISKSISEIADEINFLSRPTLNRWIQKFRVWQGIRYIGTDEQLIEAGIDVEEMFQAKDFEGYRFLYGELTRDLRGISMKDFIKYDGHKTPYKERGSSLSTKQASKKSASNNSNLSYNSKESLDTGKRYKLLNRDEQFLQKASINLCLTILEQSKKIRPSSIQKAPKKQELIQAETRLIESFQGHKSNIWDEIFNEIEDSVKYKRKLAMKSKNEKDRKFFRISTILKKSNFTNFIEDGLNDPSITKGGSKTIRANKSWLEGSTEFDLG